MIILYEDEAQTMAEHLLKKIDKDKKFDKYTQGEIVSILSFAIMAIGADLMSSVYEEALNSKENTR